MDDTVVNDDKRKLKFIGKIGQKAVLLILSDNFFGHTFILDRPLVTIGRDSESDFVIKDHLISRKHCQIGIDENNHFYIEDLDSTNSLFLNSKKLKKRKTLYYGDRINLGSTILRFFREEEAEKK